MFVQFQNRKWIYFGFQQGLSWLESKNRKNCERKSATSSLDPSIIRFYSSDGGTCVPLNVKIMDHESPTAAAQLVKQL